MSKEKEKWISDVFDSMAGSKRAQPDPALLDRIESGLHSPKPQIIPLRPWSIAVAAVLLLLLNVWSMRLLVQASETDSFPQAVEVSTEQALISTYNLYE